jgi:hypothetical protein
MYRELHLSPLRLEQVVLISGRSSFRFYYKNLLFISDTLGAYTEHRPLARPNQHIRVNGDHKK